MAEKKTTPSKMARIAVPNPKIVLPKEKKARQRVHREVDPTLLEDSEFKELHGQFKTKISLAQELILLAEGSRPWFIQS